MLDDYHVIRDRRIHEGVEFFLGYLPPSFRLVVASRLDPALPLARLRARGELTEIRAAGLRFTDDEAAGLVILRTSVLDQLCGPLCDAVLERSGSHAALADLERADLFLLALDSQWFWYRYHRLFREALRRELATVDPEAGPRLLGRAAEWYANAGEREQAVRCLIEAGDRRSAAEMLAGADDDFLTRGAIGACLLLGDSLGTEAVQSEAGHLAGVGGEPHRRSTGWPRCSTSPRPPPPPRTLLLGGVRGTRRR